MDKNIDLELEQDEMEDIGSKAILSPYEKETIITFNNADGTADIYSHDKKMIARIHEIKEISPDEVTIEKEDEFHIEATVPKDWVLRKVRKIGPTKKRDLTPEQREEQRKIFLERIKKGKEENKKNEEINK